MGATHNPTKIGRRDSSRENADQDNICGNEEKGRKEKMEGERWAGTKKGDEKGLHEKAGKGDWKQNINDIALFWESSKLCNSSSKSMYVFIICTYLISTCIF